MLPVNRWIIGETVKTVQALDLAMAEFRFDESANTIYHFVWATFCDWYLELIKGQVDEETRTVAGWVLDQILVMLHPFMRSEEHTSELQSLMRISYAVFCLKKKTNHSYNTTLINKHT